MVATGHTAVGVIVGTIVYQTLGQGHLTSGLIITGTAAITLHYLGDAIPHGHFFMTKDFKKSILPVITFDVLLPVLVFLSVIYLKNGLGEKFLYIMFSIGCSLFPDVIDGLIYTGVLKAKSILKIENDLHQKLHWHDRDFAAMPLGPHDIWQVIIILIALYFSIL
ncbi:hypothetical protein HYW41_03655 [Candidatus Daviesbacteria bacterium]|nr:hypothetical protein [Candidatus Daviesbacteria bacterium]MBI4028881.1 hypothetical protein [Candidatus Blackburnbacteria bacterium]